MKGIGRVKRVVRIVRRRFRPAAVILMYHRVADVTSDPFRLVVSPAHFAQHMALVREGYSPIRLADLAEAIGRNDVPRRAVAVTFDDGYADNYYQALPALESMGVPATVFVTTGKTDSTCPFWWDELGRVLLGAARLPECLSLTVQGQAYEWPTGTEGQRRDALAAIRDLIRPRPNAERERAMDDLLRWASLERQLQSENRAMTTRELILLSQSACMDVGAHTITHPILSAMPPEEQHREIAGSRQRLQDLLGLPVSTFAYPYGNPSDFDAASVAAVRAAGFRAAVTTIQGGAEAGDDLFRLRRCEVNDCGLEEFRYQIEKGFIS
jgi:peptidoglycan/xylan/chitin deacetylase (PgdA/CDA1 family)